MTWLVRIRQRRTIWMGGGFAICTVALLLAPLHPHAVLAGWLAAFVFCGGAPIGSLLLLLMIRVIPGRWNGLLSIPTTAFAALLPLVVIAALPVLIGIREIYNWADAPIAHGFRAVYLTPWFFDIRTILFLLGASRLTYAIIQPRGTSIRWAIIGLILFVPFQGLIAVDWLMSLDSEFHASGFGLYILSIQTTIALALAILVQTNYQRLNPGLQDDDIGLLSGLLLTALLLWAYFAFLQYLIIWSANNPAGASWYQRIDTGGWKVVGLINASLQAGLTLTLIFPPLRTSRRCLTIVAGFILVAKWIEIIRLIFPISGGDQRISVCVAILATVGLGALFAAACSRGLDIHSPRPAQAGSKP
jgi:hypothetical protein